MMLIPACPAKPYLQVISGISCAIFFCCRLCAPFFLAKKKLSATYIQKKVRKIYTFF